MTESKYSFRDECHRCPSRETCKLRCDQGECEYPGANNCEFLCRWGRCGRICGRTNCWQCNVICGLTTDIGNLRIDFEELIEESKSWNEMYKWKRKGIVPPWWRRFIIYFKRDWKSYMKSRIEKRKEGK